MSNARFFAQRGAKDQRCITLEHGGKELTLSFGTANPLEREGSLNLTPHEADLLAFDLLRRSAALVEPRRAMVCLKCSTIAWVDIPDPVYCNCVDHVDRADLSNVRAVRPDHDYPIMVDLLQRLATFFESWSDE